MLRHDSDSQKNQNDVRFSNPKWLTSDHLKSLNGEVKAHSTRVNQAAVFNTDRLVGGERVVNLSSK